MNLISTLVGLVSGIGASASYFVTGVDGAITWWQYLLITLVPTTLGFIFDLTIKILKQKKIISEEDAKEILDEIKKDKENATKKKKMKVKEKNNGPLYFKR